MLKASNRGVTLRSEVREFFEEVKFKGAIESGQEGPCGRHEARGTCRRE